MESNETSLTGAAHAESVEETLHVESTSDSTSQDSNPQDLNKIVQFPAGRFVRPPHRTTLPRRKGLGNGVVYMSAAVTKRNALRFDPTPLLTQEASQKPRPETTIIFGPAAWQLPENWTIPLGGTSFGGLNLPPQAAAKRDSLSVLRGSGPVGLGQKAKPMLSLISDKSSDL